MKDDGRTLVQCPVVRVHRASKNVVFFYGSHLKIQSSALWALRICSHCVERLIWGKNFMPWLCFTWSSKRWQKRFSVRHISQAETFLCVCFLPFFPEGETEGNVLLPCSWGDETYLEILFYFRDLYFSRVDGCVFWTHSVTTVFHIKLSSLNHWLGFPGGNLLPCSPLEDVCS